VPTHMKSRSVVSLPGVKVYAVHVAPCNGEGQERMLQGSPSPGLVFRSLSVFHDCPTALPRCLCAVTAHPTAFSDLGGQCERVSEITAHILR
jgi:hypothetical protein